MSGEPQRSPGEGASNNVGGPPRSVSAAPPRFRCIVCKGAHFVTDAKDLGISFRSRRHLFVFTYHRPTGRPRARSYCVGTIFGFTRTDLRKMIA